MICTDYGCFGYLMVRGSFRKNWSQRFVKLNGDILVLATDSSLSQIKERIIIDSQQVKIALNNATTFSLVLPNATSYQFSTNSPEDLIQWQSSISQAKPEKHVISVDSFDVVKQIGKSNFSTVFLAKLFNISTFSSSSSSSSNDNNNGNDCDFNVNTNINDNTNNDNTNNLIAIKKIYREDIYFNEIEIFSSASNFPFVVKLLFHFEFNNEYYLGLQYAEPGDLFGRLDYEVTDRDAKIYAAEILAAMNYLHKKGIIYHDLKPENVLIDSCGHLMLTDFGSAEIIGDVEEEDDPNSLSRHFCGTIEYAAPEVLRDDRPSNKADVWSYGIVLYEILYMSKPFYGVTKSESVDSILYDNVVYPEGASDEEKEILGALFEKDPLKRPSFEELKNFAFFCGLDWDLLEQKKYQTDYLPIVNKFEDTNVVCNEVARASKQEMSY